MGCHSNPSVTSIITIILLIFSISERSAATHTPTQSHRGGADHTPLTALSRTHSAVHSEVMELMCTSKSICRDFSREGERLMDTSLLRDVLRGKLDTRTSRFLCKCNSSAVLRHAFSATSGYFLSLVGL